MDQYQCIDLENVQSVSVVRFKDKKVMDPQRIEQMGRELMTLLDGSEAERILINFENVNFFSSAAINKLIVMEKRVRQRGGEIRLSNMRPEVRDLFSYTHLDSIFKIDEAQTDSLSGFNGKDGSGSEPSNVPSK